jgi:ankyrin repeat protein
VVKLLLEKAVDVNSKGKNGRTPLSWAAENGHEPVAKMLLQRGANINAQSGHFGSMLNTAAFGGHVRLLQLFLEEYRVDRHLTDDQGRSALHIAARGGHMEAVDFLLSLGLDINAKDKKGDTALHYAASGASFEVLQRILQLPQLKIFDDTSWSPLHWACRVGDAQTIKLLMDKGIKESVITTLEPPGLYTPYAIALFHQNRKLISEKGDPLQDLFGSQDVPYKATDIDMNITPDLEQEDLVFFQAQKHAGFTCDGCDHVSSNIPTENNILTL